MIDDINPSRFSEQGLEIRKSGIMKSALKNGLRGGIKGAIGSLPGGNVIVEAMNAAESFALERRLRTIELAIQELKINLQELGIKLKEDPELAQLWLIIITASGEARTEEKIKAFAQILVDAIRHNQPMSLSRIYYHIISDLEDEHIRVMQPIMKLEDKAPDPPIEGIIGDKPGASLEDLEEQLSDIAPIIKILINHLISLELVRGVMMNTWGQGAQDTNRYVLTELGINLLQFLRPPTH